MQPSQNYVIRRVTEFWIGDFLTLLTVFQMVSYCFIKGWKLRVFV